MPASDATLLAPQVRHPRRPISRSQIEIVASRSVAFFGLAFGAQTLPVAFNQREYATELWFTIIFVGLFGSLLAVVVASVLKRYVKTANTIVLAVFLLAMVTWPLGIMQDHWASPDRPWLWFLITVATACAAIALKTWIATIYVLLAPVLYGIIRISPSGGMEGFGLALLDVIYAVILGGAVLIIITMLRGAADSVDAAQATALERYVSAVREHATEVERVQVDSIVHDSVLTTLLSAARATTPEAKVLAATMAASAIGHLHAEASMPTADSRSVSMLSLGLRIQLAASTLNSAIHVRREETGEDLMPAAAAEAIYSATLQAMVNSLQHAGGVEGVLHWVTISSSPTGAILVEVGDTGSGFSIADVPVERMGVRVSIIERVANAGGIVDIDSVIGEGTAIRMRWPAERVSVVTEDEARESIR